MNCKMMDAGVLTKTIAETVDFVSKWNALVVVMPGASKKKRR